MQKLNSILHVSVGDWWLFVGVQFRISGLAICYLKTQVWKFTVLWFYLLFCMSFKLVFYT